MWREGGAAPARCPWAGGANHRPDWSYRTLTLPSKGAFSPNVAIPGSLSGENRPVPWFVGVFGSVLCVAPIVALLAQEDFTPFLGEDLLVWLVLAVGAALVVGNVAAIVRPPAEARSDDDLERAPVGRSIVMAVIGAVAAIWALVSLIA